MSVRNARPACPLSVAPMVGYTDRHFRWILRQITRRTLLYSEMVTTHALLHGDATRFLVLDPAEGPVALQLGGDDPDALARCAVLGEEAGYDEVNLNVGCPSERVQRGRFGACLMAYPVLVGRCLAVMQEAVSIPVTVKHRVGIGGLEAYADLRAFVEIVADHGCKDVIVHARIALLQGLSPKQNRSVPPLRYDDVYRLKEDFPDLTVEINGGILTLDEVATQLQRVDGVMLGRAAIDNPFLFAAADRRIFEEDAAGPTRRQVVEVVAPYVARHVAAGGSPIHVLRHLLGLFSHQPGNKMWRRALGGEVARAADSPGALLELLGRLAPRVLDAST